MALSKVFRFAVKGEHIVTVEEEVDYIKEYAKIIDYRFMGKIEVNIRMEEEVREKRVIKLLLQPLVENAVFHGLEQRVEDGAVEVNIGRKDERHLMFKVTDNGCGIEEEKLKEICDALGSKESKNGIGMSNIYQRLKLFMGKWWNLMCKAKEIRELSLPLWCRMMYGRTKRKMYEIFFGR